jgi:hypothetical protein
MTISVERCREILGADAVGKTDEQLERVRDSIAVLANYLYDQVQADWILERRERTTFSRT